MKAIEIKGLYKQFTGKRMTKVEALKGIDLSIETGEVFGFLGPNGAGKSTTIKLVMGLLRPTSGTTTIMGMDASQSESRRNVGYLPENPAFYDYLSAEKNAFATLLQVEDNILNHRPPDRIKSTHRFIKDIDIRIMNKRLRQPYPLNHPLAVATHRTLTGVPQIQACQHLF